MKVFTAISVYEVMGFHLEGRKQKAILVNGEYVDILCMAWLVENTRISDSAS